MSLMPKIRKLTCTISSYLISDLWRHMSAAITFVCIKAWTAVRLYYAGDKELIKAHN